MKKYKLIKEYPGSPRLGAIYIVDNNYSFGTPLPEEEIKNYPEFWEEVFEKDYEILSFQDSSTGEIYLKKGIKYEVVKNGYYDLQQMLYHEYIIHSVKRLSDGEVFTVGDIIYTNDFKPTKLEKITIRTNNSLAMWGKYHSDILGEVGLQTCLIKKPLFTTEDGVDIFEGYSYTVINIKNWNEWIQTAKERTELHRDYRAFASKKAAEEYIIMNKPCLSINDVLEEVPRLSYRFQEKLMARVKDYNHIK